MYQWFALLLPKFIMLLKNLRPKNVISFISLKRFLMVKDSKFIFFLLLNATQIPLIKDLQILSQHMRIVDGGLEESYLG